MSKKGRKILEPGEFNDSLKNGQRAFESRMINFNFVPYLPQMAKSAPVSFRNCEFDIDVAFSHTLPPLDFTDSDFNGKVQLHNMDFEGELLFANAEFNEEVTVNNSQFKKGCVFNGAQFHKKLTLGILRNGPRLEFVDAIFRGPIELAKDSKIGALDFTGAEFLCDVHFRSINFPAIDFSGTILSQKVDFSGSVFMPDSVFKKAQFGEADFSNCRFKGPAIFTDVVFSGKVTFEHAFFAQRADFGNSVSDPESVVVERVVHQEAELAEPRFGFANFTGVVFNREVRFHGAGFREKAIFNGLSCKRAADFSKTTYDKNAQFDQIIFEVIADFRDANFSGTASFGKAHFGDDALFNQVKSSGKLDFSSSTFKSGVVFNESDVTDKASHQSLLSLRSVEFEGHLDMNGCTIDNLDLVGTRIQSALFLGSNIRSVNRETYRIIKDNYEKANNRIEALKYYALEMNMLLGETKLFSKDWWVLSLNKWSSNHGTDWRTGVLFTLTAALLFFSAYMFFRGSRLCFETVCIDRFLSQYFAFIFPIRELKVEMIDLDKGGAWAILLSDLLGRISLDMVSIRPSPPSENSGVKLGCHQKSSCTKIM